MIDPRFGGAGAVPLSSGYAPQGIPVHHHRHRHHRTRKSRQNGLGDSPLSRDESIHKVDHGHHFQTDGAQYGNGFGVPYGAGGFAVGTANGYYSQQQQQQLQQQQQQQQQQQYGTGSSYGYGQQSAGYSQYSGTPGGTMIKHHRRHHRHRYHGADVVNHSGDQTQGIPEQLIGQRSSSVLGNEAPQVRSPIPSADDETRGDEVTHSRRRHSRHHSTDHAGYSQSHQSRINQGHTTAGPDGYGHINDDLIFIERGDHSPHRQEPPPGYEYKGKIEVQGVDKEVRSRSQGQTSALSPAPLPIQMSQPCPGASTLSGCPPGWQQMILTAAPGGPCPPGATMYHAQVIGAGGMGQAGLGGMSSLGAPTSSMGYGGVGPMGATGSGGGLANLAASLPIPPQAQLVADYIVEAGSGDMGSSGGSFPSGYQSGFAGEQTEGSSSNRATIIEVWQKRAKSEGRDKSESHSRSRSRSRSPKADSSFDFERFRNDILGAIERMVQNGGAGAKIQWTGHDGGTQTQINPSAGFDDKKETEKRPSGSGNGEVRVIVQPIQPVFYMPRQGETGQAAGPGIQQTTSSGAPNVVYIPRNVYVPVIKPVFVPRERVIVRPQVIHVARPVLVDRPVPVTQRPIIIDREKPVPVPVRGAGHESTSGKSTKEEYVYRDNLPVAYGGRCAEYAGGVEYGYTPTQQDQQYSTSGHEMASVYQEATSIPDPFQHSQSAAQLNIQQGVTGASSGGYHESYSNLVRTNSASAVNAAPISCSAPIEVLDATINNTWQRTDKSTLVRRYGRPAYDIVQKTDQVEQQMYQELRQRNGNDAFQRPGSSASYGSGSGVGGHPGYAASTGSYSSIPLGDLKHFNPEGIPHQGGAPIPVTMNY